MNLSISIPKIWLGWARGQFDKIATEKGLLILSAVLAIAATTYSYLHGYVVAYGDAESHLNIAKRVVDSLTPGFAQLGGIWLPLPHMLLVPFVKFDFLWRSGLAGSIVSGTAFIISSLYLYKLAKLITKNIPASFVAALIFMLNPNILYLQSTPMSELTLIVFSILSIYFFVRFLYDDREITSLILAAAFGFAAALSRYDGWLLILIEAGVLILYYLPWKELPKRISEVRKKWSRIEWHKLEGRVILFATLAFFSIFLWLIWDGLILGDPLYFTHSQFSAKSQQQAWLERGQLPAYQNLPVAFLYYFVTSMSNIGVVVFLISLLAFLVLLRDKKTTHRFYILLLLLFPFIFNVGTLYLGQSVIFIPHLTPTTFDWTLFNVRYGLMMVPFAAILVAYLFYRSKIAGKILIGGLLFLQIGLFMSGYSKVISMADGVEGLSSAISKLPDAQVYLRDNYDGGLVLTDDFARTISIIRTPIPMESTIYVGNKPYWEESLEAPEKYATWIVMQKDDEIWRNIYEQPGPNGRLFKYFVKVYTSPEILIFKRNPDVPAG